MHLKLSYKLNVWMHLYAYSLDTYKVANIICWNTNLIQLVNSKLTYHVKKKMNNKITLKRNSMVTLDP